MRKDRVFDLVLIALAVATAAVLFTFKVFSLPEGGDVTLVMLPIVIVALWRGLGVGITAGALYGLVELLFLGGIKFVVHPAQLVLDYPLAYGCVGLAGVFAPVWLASVARGELARGVWTAVIPGVAVGTIARYACHTVSGVIFFASYAPKGTPVLVYSAIYNSFALVSGAMVAVLAAILMPALARGVPRLARERTS